MARAREHALELGGKLGARRQRLEKPFRQDAVEQAGTPRQLIGEARAGGHDLRHQVEQRGVVVEEGEELNARRQTSQELIEAHEGDIGVGGGAESAQQQRHQFRQKLARPLAARCAVAAVMPAADDRGDGRRVGEAEPGDGLERVRVILAAGEDEVAGCGQRRCLLEERGIAVLDGRQVAQQLGRKRLERGETEKSRKPCQPGGIGRQRVRLRVVDHLQAMLDPAQEAVRLGQLRRRLGADAPSGGERGERLAGGGLAQRGQAPAPDELLRLSEELDLTDAAAAELDVVPGYGDAPAAAMRVDLTLDRVDILNRREIEVLAPQKGTQLGQEIRASGAVAGDRARFDQRGALPVLACALVISERREHRKCGSRRGGIGPQPQIGAEDIAVGSPLRHDTHQVLRQSGKELGRAAPPGVAELRGVKEHDEVDVA